MIPMPCDDARSPSVSQGSALPRRGCWARCLALDLPGSRRRNLPVWGPVLPGRGSHGRHWLCYTPGTQVRGKPCGRAWRRLELVTLDIARQCAMAPQPSDRLARKCPGALEQSTSCQGWKRQRDQRSPNEDSSPAFQQQHRQARWRWQVWIFQRTVGRAEHTVQDSFCNRQDMAPWPHGYVVDMIEGCWTSIDHVLTLSRAPRYRTDNGQCPQCGTTAVCHGLCGTCLQIPVRMGAGLTCSGQRWAPNPSLKLPAQHHSGTNPYLASARSRTCSVLSP